jgi:hypothetical protein
LAQPSLSANCPEKQNIRFEMNREKDNPGEHCVPPDVDRNTTSGFMEIFDRVNKSSAVQKWMAAK